MLEGCRSVMEFLDVVQNTLMLSLVPASIWHQINNIQLDVLMSYECSNQIIMLSNAIFHLNMASNSPQCSVLSLSFG